MIGSKPHVYVIPYPAQSHINPMLELSKCLASNNLNITFFITSLTKNSTPNIPQNTNTSITYKTISDDLEEPQQPQSTTYHFRHLQEVVSEKVISQILTEQQKGPHYCPPKLIIYDSVFPWLLEIAQQHGLLGASFFTQSCSVSAIYYHMKQGLLLRFPFEDEMEVELPFLPKLGSRDLPALDKVMDSDQTMLKVILGQFHNLHKADILLFNTFHKLEIEVIEWMKAYWAAIKTIGPTHLLLQNKLDSQHMINNHTLNLFQPSQEACTKWLDSKESGSVVYVSLGSLLSLEKSQMEELAWGLMMSKCNFLWVVRVSEEHKLPPNFPSLAQEQERGMVVTWCMQTEVLAHRAVSCFLTHGGWNSTMEGLTSGVPLIVMPDWVDQTTNAKFIEDVWRVGARVKVGENSMTSREEVCKWVMEVAQGERGKELRLNARKMKEMAEEALADGGTTAKNIQDIVSIISCV